MIALLSAQQLLDVNHVTGFLYKLLVIEITPLLDISLFGLFKVKPHHSKLMPIAIINAVFQHFFKDITCILIPHVPPPVLGPFIMGSPGMIVGGAPPANPS